MSLELTSGDAAMLAGEAGEATALAMRIIVRLAEMHEAPRLLDIGAAHIDSCLYHGRAGLDFAQQLADAGGQVVVPTTLNVSSLDLLHPERYRGDDASRAAAKALMDAYTTMGATPSWTCAPYQLPARPGAGDHIAWAESNAIVFANSVLGARTDRYGDFVDICAALTGRVPDAGLHRDDARLATVVLDVSGLPEQLLGSSLLYPVLGHLLGGRVGVAVPAIVGLSPQTSEDDLKALGAAAASSGGVAMFHAVGITPEAPDLATALGGRDPVSTHRVSLAEVAAARDALSTFSTGTLDAVSVGTPHLSVTEIEQLATLVDELAGGRDGQRFHGGIEFFANTHRFALQEAADRGLVERCEAAGVRFVVDTCTYITPILSPTTRTVMTDSAKWAYYAPGNLGVEVAFGSMRECVASAVAGEVMRDGSLW
jgi:predicted aconitase